MIQHSTEYNQQRTWKVIRRGANQSVDKESQQGASFGRSSNSRLLVARPSVLVTRIKGKGVHLGLAAVRAKSQAFTEFEAGVQGQR